MLLQEDQAGFILWICDSDRTWLGVSSPHHTLLYLEIWVPFWFDVILHIFLWAGAGGVFMGEIVSVCSWVKHIHCIFQDIEKIYSYRSVIPVGLQVLQRGQDAAGVWQERFFQIKASSSRY